MPDRAWVRRQCPEPEPTNLPVSFNLSGWDSLLDISDGKVTFVLKTAEDFRTGSVNFNSIQSGSPPILVLDTRVPGDFVNGEFDDRPHRS